MGDEDHPFDNVYELLDNNRIPAMEHWTSDRLPQLDVKTYDAGYLDELYSGLNSVRTE